MRKVYTTISEFVCPDCGSVTPLPRIHGQQRKKNHIKDIYCYKCGEIKKMREVGYKRAYKNMLGEELN